MHRTVTMSNLSESLIDIRLEVFLFVNNLLLELSLFNLIVFHQFYLILLFFSHFDRKC